MTVRIKPIVIPYSPRPQFLPYHNRAQRWAALICHRRAGKTVATLNDQIKRAVREQKSDGRYAFVLPFRQQAKEVAWQYLKRFAAPLLIENPRESELSVRLIGGATIRLYGADNPDALRGGYFDDATLDEFGDMIPEVWYEVIRPMLGDRRGSATFIGTIKGVNAFWKLFDGDKDKNWRGARNMQAEWFTMLLKASESRILPKAELDEMRHAMGDDQYHQEMECDPNVAIKGAFYADEMRTMEAEGRIRAIPISRDIPVRTGWDIGKTDSTAITFWQCAGHERRLIDYYETSGKVLTHYADVLYDKKHEHGWKYAEHYWPHDMAFDMLDADKSRIEMMRERGIIGEIVPAHEVGQGINVVRKMLARTWIDPHRCQRILDALRQYRRQWDDKLQDWRPSEYRDWTNHGCDAVRTFAVGFDDPTPIKPRSERNRVKNDPGATSWAA